MARDLYGKVLASFIDQHPRQLQAQTFDLDRFGYIAISARTFESLALTRLGMGRDHDDRQMFSRSLLLRTDTCKGLEPIHNRHHDIHQHDIKLEFAQALKRLGTITYNHSRVTQRIQHSVEQTLVYRIVFGYQHLE